MAQQDDLAKWAAAHGPVEAFRPALLAEPDIRILAVMRTGWLGWC